MHVLELVPRPRWRDYNGPRKSYNILLHLEIIAKKKQKKKKSDSLRYSRLQLLPRSCRRRFNVVAAAGKESSRGMRGATRSAQRCIQQQPQRTADQMRRDLLDKSTRIEASATVPAAGLLLLWQFGAAVSLLRYFGHTKFGLDEAAQKALGEGQWLRRTLILGILQRANSLCN